MPDAAPFGPDPAAAIARVRRHSVGDLLRRTGLRHPAGLAVVDGDRRAAFVEFDAAAGRTAHELAAEHVDAHVREHLAGYERPPYAVFADAPPEDPGGTIVERDLRAALAQG